MSVAPYISRVLDAAVTTSAIARDAFLDRLGDASVTVEVADGAADEAGQAWFDLAVNLAARLYPTVRLVATDSLVKRAAASAQRINPEIDVRDIDAELEKHEVRVVYGGSRERASDVRVAVDGWNVAIDNDDVLVDGPAAIAAALAGACVGMSDVFRTVFADQLDRRGRTGPEAGSLNLVTLESWTDHVPIPDGPHDLGRFHLAGCGAIGQATVFALSKMPVYGTVVAVDHEPVDQSNVQRYVLTGPDDEGTAKVDLVARALAETDLNVTRARERWGQGPETQRTVETVLTALDTERDRIAVQTGLPHRIYNAWTDPTNIGWSRHERFGDDPCLACLYYPTEPKPHQYQRIARALNQEEMRVRLYMASKTRVGKPLPTSVLSQPIAAPVDVEASVRWAEEPLLNDLVAQHNLDAEQASRFADHDVDQLHHEVVCGTAPISFSSTRQESEVAVPLAHQSAMAGVMLAVQLTVAHSDELARLRPDSVESHYDMLKAMPSQVTVPSAVEPACICQDPVYRRRWADKWTDWA